MTTFDADLAHTTDRTVTRPGALLDRLRDGSASYGVILGGQGGPWLPTLADLARDHGLGGELLALVRRAAERLAPVADELARVDAPFEPLAWADALAVGESAEDLDAPTVPSESTLAAPAASVPGILLAQLAAVRALRGWGLDPTANVPVTGHSQGSLAAAVLTGADELDVLVLSRLVGVATQLVARRRGLLGGIDRPVMLAVTGVRAEQVDEILAELPASLRVVRRMRNARRGVVLSGPSEGLAAVQTRFAEVAAEQKAARDRKTTGGAPFAPVLDELPAAAAFHHPDLAGVADVVAAWAPTVGLDADWARTLTADAVIDPVDWVADLTAVLDAGPQWLLDLGPTNLATQLSTREAKVRGAACLAVATRRGARELVAPGAAPVRPTPWSAHLPRVVHLPDGSVRLETAFTRLTGHSPILLAGMTPTTVDAPIVAAAANAGFWAELAGGGQVTEEIFTARLAELDDLLEPGRGFAFNSLFLDPYLWKLQLGQKRLVQRARAAGSPIEAVIVTAGIPELDEAVALVEELREVGIEHVVFKPGTVRQIKQVLAIAEAVAPVPIIVQIEGGKAGGHHSWEDLDELLITTYPCLLYTSPSPRDKRQSRMPSSA